jgi:hypothetical protein
LRWFEEPELRRMVTAELNKGEARNSLARASPSTASDVSGIETLKTSKSGRRLSILRPRQSSCSTAAISAAPLTN